MDIAALQSRLRQFAAERNWQPFHTPKNLSTALFVEAAELAEIFQWMTTEESSQAGADPVQRERIGAEVADVLLYLLQLADHCGVDIEQAVDAKIVANARKYPGRQAAALQRVDVSPGPAAIHVLIDYENVQPTLAEIQAAAPGASTVWVFHGPHQKQVDQAYPPYGDRVTAVPISKTGKNALDFHLSYYLGYLASRNDKAEMVVMANDTGYEPMLMHARAMGIQVRRVAVHRTAKRATAPSGKSAVQTQAPMVGSEVVPAAALPVVQPGGSGKTSASTKADAPTVVPPARTAAVKKVARKTPAIKQAATKQNIANQALDKAAASKQAASKKVAAKKASTQATAAARKVAARKSAPSKKAAAGKTASKQPATQRAKSQPTAAKKAASVTSRPKPTGPAAGTTTPTRVTVDSTSKHDASVAVTPELLRHAVDSLRKMDDKRPVRLTGLRGALKSLLGSVANEQTIAVAIERLAAQGYLDLTASPKVSFPRFTSAGNGGPG
ncbi:MAG: nucleotide pyrophosphohydrolase [Burkholderiales bacterium]|nr:nucleotide pyrophosphohydrolase [Burkholderiales bacterium]